MRTIEKEDLKVGMWVFIEKDKTRYIGVIEISRISCQRFFSGVSIYGCYKSCPIEYLIGHTIKEIEI